MKYSIFSFLHFFRNGVHLKASFFGCIHQKSGGSRGEKAFQKGKAGGAGGGFRKNFYLSVFFLQTPGQVFFSRAISLR